MSKEWKTRGARARAAMAAGATLDDVLGTHKLGAIGSIRLLREIAPIPLWCLKILVGNSGSYAHLTLADLEMLGNAPPDGVDFFIHSHRNEAIIERKPTGQAGPGEVPNLQLAGKAARARRSKGGSVIARSRARPSLAPNRFKDFWRE